MPGIHPEQKKADRKTLPRKSLPDNTLKAIGMPVECNSWNVRHPSGLGPPAPAVRRRPRSTDSPGQSILAYPKPHTHPDTKELPDCRKTHAGAGQSSRPQKNNPLRKRHLPQEAPAARCFTRMMLRSSKNRLPGDKPIISLPEDPPHVRVPCQKDPNPDI